jgi:hypothetical protein
VDPDQYVFGPPGSGCSSVLICKDPDPDLDPDQQAKKVGKTLIYTIFSVFHFFLAFFIFKD